MTSVSLLGVPHDDYSSHLKGAAGAPGPIRDVLWSDAHGLVSETRVDLGEPSRLIDHGDVAFDAATDPWEAIEARVGEVLEAGHPLISLGGDHGRPRSQPSDPARDAQAPSAPDHRAHRRAQRSL
jgi:arginase